MMTHHERLVQLDLKLEAMRTVLRIALLVKDEGQVNDSLTRSRMVFHREMRIRLSQELGEMYRQSIVDIQNAE